MIGGRLKLARTGRGLSLRSLAEKLRQLVSAQALGKYERDEMMPSTDVLIALARALDVSENYLLSTGEVELVNVEFRKLKLTATKQEASLKAQVLSAVERYLEIEDIVAAESTEWNPPADFPYRVLTMECAELAADSLRAKWSLGLNPIPVLAEFLEERGIKVLTLDLPESVSGMMAKVHRLNGRDVPVIVVNKNHPGERQRFTLAHELGHLVLTVDGDVDMEKCCHRFAGAFLIPRMVLEAEAGRHRHRISWAELFRLKRLFGASVQAIVYRMKDLDIIPETVFTQMFRFMSKQGWRAKTGEPEPLPKEETHRFERLCFRALVEQLISDSKAAELLNVTVRELNKLLDQGVLVEA